MAEQVIVHKRELCGMPNVPNNTPRSDVEKKSSTLSLLRFGNGYQRMFQYRYATVGYVPVGLPNMFPSRGITTFMRHSLVTTQKASSPMSFFIFQGACIVDKHLLQSLHIMDRVETYKEKGGGSVQFVCVIFLTESTASERFSIYESSLKI